MKAPNPFDAATYLPGHKPTEPIGHEHPAPATFQKHDIELRVTIPTPGGGRLKDDMQTAKWVQNVIRYRLHNQDVTVELVMPHTPDTRRGAKPEMVSECTRADGHPTPCNGWPREEGCPIADPLPWSNGSRVTREVLSAVKPPKWRDERGMGVQL